MIALISDQSVKAEVAWRLPYYLSKRLGHFDFGKIAKEESAESLEAIIKEKPALHRYPRKMAEYIFFAIKKVVEDYNSEAENMKNVILKSFVRKEQNSAKIYNVL